MRKTTSRRRASGVLLHVSSLPSRYGIGDVGPEAYRFVDFLVRAGQRFWQVLPLGPVASGADYCPYSSLSAFAGNTLFISPDLMYMEGLIGKRDLSDRPDFARTRVEYGKVRRFKQRLLDIAFERFGRIRQKPDYTRFCANNRRWLEDFALFTVLLRHFRGQNWSTWPIALRDRHREALRSEAQRLREEIEREKFSQYVFFRQWLSLRDYCRGKGVRIIGDIPIYVHYDSADVWSNPSLFKLTESKRPKFVGGVPPDYFSRSGQLWGSPVYNWQALRRTGYEWWVRRIMHNLRLFDFVRIDHFRGFVAYWQVAARNKTAASGQWVRVPTKDFLGAVLRQIPASRLIVEDLGHITPAVKKLIGQLDLTCTRVLLFGFGGEPSRNPNSPCNHVENCVLYTGTHDNNTIRGWIEKEATLLERDRLYEQLGHTASRSRINWEVVRLAMSSIAWTVVIAMQDILGLGQEARMNRPGTTRGNWRWRLRPSQITSSVSRRLAETAAEHQRV